MIHTHTARLADDAHADIGEGPAWDTAAGRLLWVDIPSGTVRELGGEPRQWSARTVFRLGGPVGAVIPRRSGGLLLAAGTTFLTLDEENGRTDAVARIDADPARIRFNDAKCDPAGRLWAGTQGLRGEPGAGAELYRLEADGTVRTMLTGVQISNGLDWSPDGRYFYYIDTPTLGVDVFDVDPADGSLHGRRRLIGFRRGEGRPDGMAVDHQGHLWIALFYRGQVHGYRPDGTLCAVVEVPAPQVTSCAFGGPEGRHLFITTASHRMPDERVRDAGMPADLADRAVTAPGAGGLFVCEPGVSGPAATAWAG